ncbi:BspA family leucine-rich repeat surface protein, partial [bacterium]|nr:BspA family leucine-rich repeat surface protein [bacterium]
TRTQTPTPTLTPTETIQITPTPTVTPTSTIVDFFSATWDTSISDDSTTGNNQLLFPLRSDGSYNFTIYWGDGNTSAVTSYSQLVHTYTTPGIYTTIVTGPIEGFGFVPAAINDSVKLLHINRWGQLRLGNGGSYFSGATNLTLTGTTDYPSLIGTTNLSYMFANCISLNTINNSNSWNTSGITDMTGMFSGATGFNHNINVWDVSNVTGMSKTFSHARSFNQPLSGWSMSNVVTSSEMFRQARVFNQPINNWITTGITDMSGMFWEARTFNQPLNSWDVSNVLSMNNMFRNATGFNQNINVWDVSSVTGMNGTFRFDRNEDFSATSLTRTFNQPLSGWDVSSVIDMGNMFSMNLATINANDSFNQPLNNWSGKTSAVTNMELMFYVNQVFNQPLSGWDV